MRTKTKTIIFLISFSLFLIVFFYFFIFSTLKEISKISKQIRETEQKILFLEKRKENISNFKEKVSANEEFFQEIERAILKKDLPIDFIRFLEEKAKEQNLIFDIYSSNILKDSISFKAKIAGSPQNLFKFLEIVENSPYLIQFEKLAISKLTESDLKTKNFERLSLSDLRADISIWAKAE